MKNPLTRALLFLLPAFSAIAQTATVTPSATSYSTAGGTLTFSVNLGYTGVQSALGLSVATVPPAWTYGITAGANVPDVRPVTGDTDNFEFADFTIPASPVSFTYTIIYPAGLTGIQTFGGITAIFRSTAGTLSSIPVAAIVITSQQAITFPALATKTFGDPPFALTATASSGLPVSYVSSDPSVVSISGGTVTVVGAGAADITASQLGNASFAAAPTVVRTQTVNKAGQTITFGALANKTVGDAPFTVSASASSGLTPTFSIVSGPATISGSTVTLTGVGTVVVRAAQVGNANYNAANTVDQSFTVTAAGNFASWQQSKFTAAELLNPSVSGPTAVFGVDGLTNLVKYALGLEPKTNITSGLPTATASGSEWYFTYTRSASITDVTYTVEVSTNLSAWSTVGVTHELVSSSGGFETWRGRTPLSSAPNAYFRLRIVQP